MMFLFPTTIMFGARGMTVLPDLFWLVLTEKTRGLKNGNRETNEYVRTSPSGALNVHPTDLPPTYSVSPTPHLPLMPQCTSFTFF